MRPIFLDEIVIHLQAGRGGDGAVSFRREKYEPRGGPDGGDGGRGGHILLVVDESLNTLGHLQPKKCYQAGSGQPGGGQNKTGRQGKDLRLRVPPGTLVYHYEKKTLLKDLKTPEEEWVAARGGRGGRGNTHFKRSTRQSPRFAQEGEAGEERFLLLELRLLAQVGLVGLPNAGKSTLLSQITRARPKVASYPFTTLRPHLGVVQLDALSSFVVADIPGLIEGAHQGAGLGDEFLRHIERTRLLFHLVDGSGLEGRDPLADFELINGELFSYHPRLLERKQLVIINKMDLQETREQYPRLQEALSQMGYEVFPISAATGEGIPSLLTYAYQELQAAPDGEILIHDTPGGDEEASPMEPLTFTIQQKEGVYMIVGEALEKKAQEVNPTQEEDLLAFADLLRQLGVEEALRKEGALDGDLVRLGPLEFTFVE